MRRAAWLWVCLLLWLTASDVMARKPRPAPTQSGPPFALATERLPNGMTVWCQPRPGSTSIVALIAIRAGSRHEDATNNGISHFLEHMIFTGTERWDEEETKEVITRRGGEWNGWTSAEDTIYYAHVSTDDLDAALDWLSQVVFHATLPEDKIDKERQVIFQERWGRYGWIINTLDNLGFGYELDRDVRRALFPDSSLGLRISGEDASLEQIDRAALLGFYRRYYVPANTALIVVGNIAPEQVVERARAHFAGVDPGDSPAAPVPPVPADGLQRVVIRGPMPTEQVRLMMGARTVGRTHPDNARLDVLAELLEQSLTEDIRYQRGLVYSLQAYTMIFDDAGYFVVATNSERDHQPEIMATVDAHLERIRRGEVAATKVAEARTALKGRWALAMEDNLERASWMAQWVWLPTVDGQVPDHIGAIDAVTAEDLSRLVSTYFVPDRRYIGLHQPAVTVTSGARTLGILTGAGLVAWLASKAWRRLKARTEISNNK